MITSINEFRKIVEGRLTGKQYFPSYLLGLKIGLDSIYTDWKLNSDPDTFANEFFKAWEKDDFDKCGQMYYTILNLNPQLKQLPVKTYSEVYDVVYGAISKFNFDDIKHYTELAASGRMNLAMYNMEHRQDYDNLSAKFGVRNLDWVLSPKTIKILQDFNYVHKQ